MILIEKNRMMKFMRRNRMPFISKKGVLLATALLALAGSVNSNGQPVSKKNSELPQSNYSFVSQSLSQALMGVEKEDTPPSTHLSGLKKITEEIKEEAKNLPEPEKLLLAGQLLDLCDKNTQQVSKTQKNMQDTSKELELFYNQGNAPENHILSRINNTKTAFGQVTLGAMLMEPLDIESLKKRQNLIKKITCDNKLYTQLESAISTVAVKQSKTLAVLAKRNNALDGATSFLGLYAPKFIDSVNQSLHGISIFRALTNSISQGLILGAVFGGVASTVKIIKEENNSLTSNLRCISAGAGISAGIYGSLGFGLSYLTNLLQANETALNCLHANLTGAKKLLDAVHELKKVADQNPVVAQGLMHQKIDFDHFEQQTKEIAELKTLVHELESATFSDPYRYFTYSARILHANRLMEGHKNEFAALTRIVGEADAVLSIAKTVKNSEKNNNKYCFVEYANQATPYMKLDSVWNPAIGPENAVPNNIELGTLHNTTETNNAPQKAVTNPHVAVFTGGNTSGKSAFIKATTLAAMFARLGIAPAQKAVMTPFSYIGTSMNIADNTAEGSSRYKAETVRAACIEHTLKALPQGQCALAVIDEPYGGTGKNSGEKAAVKLVQRLCSLPQAIVMLATHHKGVTDVAATSNGQCENYKMESSVDQKGKLIRTFKLEKGIAQNLEEQADAVLQDTQDNEEQ
jgi:DNA mismatch repair ATPase MutS